MLACNDARATAIHPTAKYPPPANHDTLRRMRCAQTWALAALAGCGPVSPADPADTTGATTGAPTTTGALPTGSATTTTAADPGSTGGAMDCAHVCADPRTHDGDLTVTPDTDPTTLECLHTVTGNLHISDFVGPLPSELRSLHEVGELLTIEHNLVHDLQGLECLERVKGLAIEHNDALADITALAGLQASRFLFISGGDALADLSPLSGVQDFEHIQLQFATGVETLPTFPPGTHLLDLYLWDSPRLTDLDPLAGVQGTPNQIELARLPALTSVAGLAGMWTDEDPADLSMGDLPALTSLAGLEGIRRAQYLSLSDLPQITSLAPLTDLETAEFLNLAGLPVSSLAELANLKAVTSLRLGSCEFAGLPALVDLAGLASLESLETLILAGLPALESLDLPALVTGPVILTAVDCPALSADELAEFGEAHGAALVCQTPPDVCDCF